MEENVTTQGRESKKNLIMLAIVAILLLGAGAYVFLGGKDSRDSGSKNAAVQEKPIAGNIVAGKVPGQSASGAGQESPWLVRCSEISEDKTPKGPCEIFQMLMAKESGQRFIEFAVGYPEDKKDARGIIILPLGISLPDAAMMKVDDGQSFKFDIRYCRQDGCFAYLNLTDAVLKKLNEGEKVTITFSALNGQKVNAEMSLKGFAKALAAAVKIP